MASDLQYGQLAILFDEHVLDSECARLRRVDAQNALEAASADLLERGLHIIDVADADRTVVELFGVADSGGPPLGQLEN